MENVYGWLIEISGTWGVRKLLRVMKRQMLSRITKRVQVRISDEQHFVHSGDASRCIEFVAFVDNPTPLSIAIKGGKITVFNYDIPIAEIDALSVNIPKECQNYRITLAFYKPFLYPVGIPVRNDYWKLDVNLEFSCYYGEWWTRPIKSGYFTVLISGQTWEELRDWVVKKIHDTSA